MFLFNSSNIEMKPVVLAIILVLAGVSRSHQLTPGNKRNADRATAAQREAWNTMKQSFTKYSNFISGNLWALVHTYRSEDEMERSLKLFESIALTLARNNPASLKAFEGPTGFKSQLVQLMHSNDDTVSGFAANLLAILGDQSYAPEIAELLNRKGDETGDDYPSITVRGRAATALGLMGAREYTNQIALLLKNGNDYDRSGAAQALGYLKATERAGDIVALLTTREAGHHDCESLISSLIDMGVAADYKKEIGALLYDHGMSETSTAAAYALAHLRAREFAKDVAPLLPREFQKGDAAKALAFMGATDYAAEIALMLKDESSLVRKDAALALAIMGAKEFAPDVFKLLHDPTKFVRYYGAVALVLLEANGYAASVVPLIVRNHKSGIHLSPDLFHAFVRDEAVQIDKEFKEKLARMKLRTTRRRQPA